MNHVHVSKEEAALERYWRGPLFESRVRVPFRKGYPKHLTGIGPTSSSLMLSDTYKIRFLCSPDDLTGPILQIDSLEVVQPGIYMDIHPASSSPPRNLAALPKETLDSTRQYAKGTLCACPAS